MVAPHLSQNRVSLMLKYEIRTTTGIVTIQAPRLDNVGFWTSSNVLENPTNKMPLKMTNLGNHLRLKTVSLLSQNR
jgi:hypothetical protein